MDVRVRTVHTCVLATLLATTVAAAGLAVQRSRTAAEERTAALVQNLKFRAETMRDQEPATALRLSIAAHVLGASPGTEAQLTALATRNRYLGEINAIRAAYAPDGRTVLAGGHDGGFALWDIRDPTRPQRLAELPGGRGTTYAFAPDRPILLAGDKGVLAVWDITDLRRPQRVATVGDEDGDRVESVTYSGDGRTVLTGGAKGTITLWTITDPRRPRKVSEVDSGHPITSAVLWPDGRTAAVSEANGATNLWSLADPTRPTRLARLTADPAAIASMTISMALSRDGRRLLTGGAGPARWWDVADPTRPRQIAALPGTSGNSWVAALSPDGTRALTAGDTTATVWELTGPARPRQLLTLESHTQTVRTAAFSPAQTQVLTGGGDGKVILWDITDRMTRLATMDGGAKYVVAAQLGPDGRTAFTVARDSIVDSPAVVTSWDVTYRGAPRVVARRPVGRQTWSAAVSPDGQLLITVGERTIAWAIGAAGNPRPLSVIGGGAVRSADFSPDGRRLFLHHGDTVTVWRIVNGQPVLARFDASSPRQVDDDFGTNITALAFSRDGRMAFTGSEDGWLAAWQTIDRGQPTRLATVPAHKANITAISLDASGGTVLTGSVDGTAVLWDFSRLARIVASPHDRACAIVGRGLSEREWKRYAPDATFRPTCPPRA